MTGTNGGNTAPIAIERSPMIEEGLEVMRKYMASLEAGGERSMSDNTRMLARTDASLLTLGLMICTDTLTVSGKVKGTMSRRREPGNETEQRTAVEPAATNGGGTKGPITVERTALVEEGLEVMRKYMASLEAGAKPSMIDNTRIVAGNDASLLAVALMLCTDTLTQTGKVDGTTSWRAETRTGKERRETTASRTTAETIRRAAGVAGWLLAGEAMITIGSIQGVTGSLVSGWALYWIIAREWTAEEARAKLITLHALQTTGVVIAAATAALALWTSSIDWRIPWEQLPMVTIALAALHNAHNAPALDKEQFPVYTAPNDIKRGAGPRGKRDTGR